MGKMFNPDGKFSNLLNRIADFVVLGVLWLVCCLPVFTVGAATTALYYASLKLLDGKESYITKDFFRAFKLNFRQATILWLMALAVGAFLVFDAVLCYHKGFNVAFVAVAGLLVIYVLILLYLFPYLSKFYCTVPQAVKAALVMCFRHFGESVMLLAADVVIVLVATQLTALIPLLPAIFAYVNALTFRRIFKKYIPQTPEEPSSPDVQTHEI